MTYLSTWYISNVVHFGSTDYLEYLMIISVSYSPHVCVDADDEGSGLLSQFSLFYYFPSIHYLKP